MSRVITKFLIVLMVGCSANYQAPPVADTEWVTAAVRFGKWALRIIRKHLDDVTDVTDKAVIKQLEEAIKLIEEGDFSGLKHLDNIDFKYVNGGQLIGYFEELGECLPGVAKKLDDNLRESEKYLKEADLGKVDKIFKESDSMTEFISKANSMVEERIVYLKKLDENKTIRGEELDEYIELLSYKDSAKYKETFLNNAEKISDYEKSVTKQRNHVDLLEKRTRDFLTFDITNTNGDLLLKTNEFLRKVGILPGAKGDKWRDVIRINEGFFDDVDTYKKIAELPYLRRMLLAANERNGNLGVYEAIRGNFTYYKKGDNFEHINKFSGDDSMKLVGTSLFNDRAIYNLDYLLVQLKDPRVGKDLRTYVCITGSQIFFHSILSFVGVHNGVTKNNMQDERIKKLKNFCEAKAASAA